MEAVIAIEETAVSEPLDFDALLRDNQAMVFSIAWNYLRNQTAAEEIAQEVFLKLFECLQSIESADHARFWLRRVASQRSIDRTRRHWWQREVAIEAAADVASAPAPADVLASARLGRLVAALPEKLRMVVILRYQEDLGPEEIAATLDIPVRTVKAHLHRALELLREKDGRLRLMETSRASEAARAVNRNVVRD
ncbi:MAG: sigma-70 family RNA polymerase sigma factor [Acidobacteria bacterium]|nr:sigma-70 family RNA polymerase sigma factor [Acidobacteriota bacterium]